MAPMWELCKQTRQDQVMNNGVLIGQHGAIHRTMPKGRAILKELPSA